ncbi:DUF2062 domain-containing protein [Microaerobacter geothermalis]|uniref:DUF2062 domain-containing protein n=1 Tax=Microaerobacter geothermalis TaxID=674972 RepID=UPI001F213741|nr:DUF2062 domain-containing protein [Microaerobacter geothermalis]MCF6094048.1 DUF2062 domain-containing protein [Microaerobacter geothermalis]
MLKKILRSLRLQYLKLLRTKGAPAIVARGFAIGIFIEFITLPTLGVAVILLYPLVRLFKGNLPASIIGFIIGKFIIPLFLYFNLNTGMILIGDKVTKEMTEVSGLALLKEKGVALILGSAINGFIVAIFSFFLVYILLGLYRKKKERKLMEKHFNDQGK